MNNRIKKIALLFILTVWHPNFILTFVTKITKINHHKNSSTKPSIEKGVISFYFTHEPVIHSTKKSIPKENKLIRIFTISDVEIGSGIPEKSLQELLNFENKWYKISMEQFAQNKKIIISITYNPDLVRLSWSNFDAIKQEKGFLIQLYDLALLEKIQSKQSPVIEIADSGNRAVVIDCGHGGGDHGALSYDGKLIEKELCLDIGKSTKQLLNNQGVKVFLIRTDDQYISLEDRTSFSNAQDAKLLVSIHANAGACAAQGIESFYCNPDLLRCKGTDLPYNALNRVKELKNLQAARSSELAQKIQTHTVCQARTMFFTPDRKVKSAVGQLFIGSSSLPTALIEIGFLSNKQEGEMLKNLDYQKKIAQGIALGIISFFDDSFSC